MRSLFLLCIITIAACESKGTTDRWLLSGEMAAADSGLELPQDAGVADTGPGSGSDSDADSDSGAEDGGGHTVVDSSQSAGPMPVGPCGICKSENPCGVAACENRQCVRLLQADGYGCDESGAMHCVAGACVERGCGDRFRELGPLPEREACDDGNVSAADGCDHECQVLPVLADPDDVDALTTYPSPQRASVATDPGGALLWVYTRSTASGVQVRGRLFAAGEDKVLILSDVLSSEPVPEVIARPSGGFLVAWNAQGSADKDVVFRSVGVDGAMGPRGNLSARTAGNQGTPRGVVVGQKVLWVWIDQALGLRGRWFSATGLPSSDDFAVDASAPARKHAVHLAAGTQEGRWMVAWVERGVLATNPWRLRARRFDGVRSVDALPVELASRVVSAALSGGDSGYLVAYGTEHDDGLGNIYGRTLSETTTDASEAFELAVNASVREVEPSVARLGDGWIVGYWNGQPGRVRLLEVGAEPPVEIETLRDRLASGAESNLSLSRVKQGVWFAWSGVDGGTVRPTMSLFFLPDN